MNLHLSNGSTPYVCSSSLIQPSTWYFVANTFNGTTGRVYVNGAQVATLTTSYGLNSATAPLWIGGDNYHFQCLLDDVRLYNRALSAGEIAAMYLSHN